MRKKDNKVGNKTGYRYIKKGNGKKNKARKCDFAYLYSKDKSLQTFLDSRHMVSKR